MEYRTILEKLVVSIRDAKSLEEACGAANLAAAWLSESDELTLDDFAYDDDGDFELVFEN